MPKSKKKNIKVRDLNPKKDAKGGKAVQGSIETGIGGGKAVMGSGKAVTGAGQSVH